MRIRSFAVVAMLAMTSMVLAFTPATGSAQAGRDGGEASAHLVPTLDPQVQVISLGGRRHGIAVQKAGGLGTMRQSSTRSRSTAAR
jgi:hypothetical protein